MPRSILRSPRSFLLLAGLALPVVAGAQAAGGESQPYQQTLSINPIALPFGLFSAEFERVVGTGFTIGAGGSYFSGDLVDDDEFDSNNARDAWIHAKLKYYPGERALRGFAVGLTAGYHNAEDEVQVSQPGGGISTVTRSEGAATLGIVLDYNWLIGRRDRFLVGIGIGARRVMKDVDSESALAQVYPDGRLQIGLAF